MADRANSLEIVESDHALQAQTNRPISYQHILKDFIKLMGPITITEILEALRDFINNILLAKLGKQELAAASFITTMTDFCTAALPAFIFCLPTILVRHIVAEDFEKVGTYYRMSQMMMLMVSVPIIAIYLNSERLLQALGQDAKITTYVQQYYNIATIGVPFYMSVISGRQLLFALDKATIAVKISALDVAMYVGISYALTFNGGLGIEGLGWAEFIRAITTCFIYEAYFYFSELGAKYKLYQFNIKKHFNKAKALWFLGYPLVIQMGAELGAYFTLANFVGRFGEMGLIAYQIVASYLLFTSISTLGIKQAIEIKVSEMVAALDLENLHRYAKTAILSMLSIDVLFFLIFAISNKYLMKAYIDVDDPVNTNLIEVTHYLFMIRYGGQIFSGLKHVCTGILRGMKYTFWPMIINLFALWLGGIGLSNVFGIHLFDSVMAMMGGYNIGMAVGCVGMAAFCHYKSRRLPTEQARQPIGLLSGLSSLFGRRQQYDIETLPLLADNERPENSMMQRAYQSTFMHHYRTVF